MTAKITQFADLKNDNTLITPQATLADAGYDIECGAISPQKLIVIALTTTKDDEEGYYHINSYTSNMTVSEQIALLEMQKAILTKALMGAN